MSRYDLVINAQPFTVEFQQVSGNQASVLVNGVSYNVQLPSGVAPVAAVVPAAAPAPNPAAPPPPPKAAAPAAGPTITPCAGELVVAPMPGQIISVPVKEGDRINSGDTVVVMEAMKMENEIKSHVSGTVVRVSVSKGQSVSVGDALVMISG